MSLHDGFRVEALAGWPASMKSMKSFLRNVWVVQLGAETFEHSIRHLSIQCPERFWLPKSFYGENGNGLVE